MYVCMYVCMYDAGRASFSPAHSRRQYETQLAGCQGIVNIKIILSYIKANEMHENFSFDMNLNLLM